jgi:hypothetical protein
VPTLPPIPIDSSIHLHRSHQVPFLPLNTNIGMRQRLEP